MPVTWYTRPLVGSVNCTRAFGSSGIGPEVVGCAGGGVPGAGGAASAGEGAAVTGGTDDELGVASGGAPGEGGAAGGGEAGVVCGFVSIMSGIVVVSRLAKSKRSAVFVSFRTMRSCREHTSAATKTVASRPAPSVAYWLAMTVSPSGVTPTLARTLRKPKRQNQAAPDLIPASICASMASGGIFPARSSGRRPAWAG